MASAFSLSRTGSPRNLFSDDDFAVVRRFFTERPGLAPTPLHRCPALARQLGIGELLVKDESGRFGLNAFKAVGATFAVETLKARDDLRAGDTLVCASEGNHGRAVASVARLSGCHARVYLSESVAAPRVAAIRAEGAEAILVRGDYDEAVRVMAREAAAAGWLVISDTSWPGYSEVPRLIMLGYTRVMDEDWGESAVRSPESEVRSPKSEVRSAQSDVRPPDAIFVPGGVGGLLAAVACWNHWRYGVERPQVICVEPLSAACLQESARRGRPTALPGPFETVMAGLRCGEMSPDVYPVISTLVDAYVGIEDEVAFDAMRLLARAAGGDPQVVAGAAGAAALAGLLAATEDPAVGPVARRLGLGPETRVQVLVTEGPTDPALHQQILARR